MIARRAAVLDDQPTLWDDPQPAAPTPDTPKTVAKPAARRLRNHVLGMSRPWPEHMPCAMTCLVCDQTEGSGVCPDGCAIICGRPTPLDREKGKAPVEVCVVTLTLHARLLGPHAAVACPHCDATHGHPTAAGRRYRIGPCGQPYIVHLPEMNP